MLKQYVKWQIRQWWPLLLIFSALLTLIFGTACTEASFSYIKASATYGTLIPGVELLPLAIAAYLATIVMPIFVFKYRTRQRSVDIYFQSPHAPGKIKRARVFIGLVMLLIAVSVAFLLGFLIYLGRYFSLPQTKTIGGEMATLQPVNFIFFLPSYAAILVFVTASYLINCFLADLGDYGLDQVFLTLFGNVFLALCITAPMLVVLEEITIHYPAALANVSFPFELLELGFGPTGAVAFLSAVMEKLTYAVVPVTASAIYASVSFGMQILLGIFALVWILRTGEPNGDHVDTRGSRNKAVALIPHGAALVLGIVLCGFFITSTSLSVLSFFVFFIYVTLYYVMLSLWRHSFRPTRFDLWFFIGISVFCFGLLLGTTIDLQALMNA